MLTKKRKTDIAGTCAGFPDVRHEECNGQLAIGGEGWLQFPIGLGFGPDGRFRVDAGRWRIYTGWCLKCGAAGDFVRRDQKTKLVTRYPNPGKRGAPC